MQSAQELSAVKARTAMHFVDTSIIPDRNAGIGSLLWDLQNPQNADQGAPPLLGREFAFIDVGVSRAKVATTLKTLLANDLEMHVDYVATERPEAVPYAHVTLVGDSAEKIRECLSQMISSRAARREVKDWHCVIDCHGKVSSIAYSYMLQGNEVWEPYYMGRSFLYAGELVEFSHPQLDALLALDVRSIEAAIDLERKRDGKLRQPARSWPGYVIERNPLETGLAEFGITLQKTDVPRRIEGKQNVLFLGNVLNHYPRDEQSRELDRIAASLQEGDLIIIQVDEVETSAIEVLVVRGQGIRTTRERVRWINTRTMEIEKLLGESGTWQRIQLKPVVERTVRRLVDFLETTMRSPEWRREVHKTRVHRTIRQVALTFFRAVPVEETLRIALRQTIRRLPSNGELNAIPVFSGDTEDAYGGALGPDTSPIVSEANFIRLGLTS